ncbi:MAG: methionyl-tRNA formyltransferase [Flavobacteriaceae bacterium]|nr:methionyl-tRNA formyltransferase [Flavobacteriaceae bacterium]
MRKLRIVFMGTPHFAVGILQKLLDENYSVVGVITAPDKPAGRGRAVSQSAVKEFALSKGLTVLQPTNLKDETFLQELRALDANLQIVVAFRMLPKVVWQLPEYGTFNLHASLLPQYRGAAPINWAIIHGEKETGVTTFFIDEKIDTGAMIASKRVSIKEDETFESLHNTLMEVGSNLVIHTVRLIEEDASNPVSQSSTATLKEAPKLTPENTRIDWNQSVETIDCLIRGLSPYPTAWTELQTTEASNIKVKIYQASLIEEVHSHQAGRIFTTKKQLKVAGKNGYLVIEELQLPGKKRLKSHELLNGYSFPEGTHFV